ncbi:MAG: alpha/beta hydrolase family protein [Aestuariibacter sp.]
MKLKYFTSFFLVVTLGLVSAITVAQSASKIPTEAFSRLPLHERPVLSPDGSKVAYIHNYTQPEISILTVYHSESQKLTYLMKSDNEKLRIRWFNWANNSTIVGGIIYPTADFGVEYSESRLFAVDVNSPEQGITELIKPKRFGNHGVNHSQYRDDVIDLMLSDPDHILVAVDLDRANEPSVYKINVNTGKKKRLIKGKRKVRDWITDRQNKVRLAVSLDYKDGERSIFWLPDEEEDWIELFNYNAMTEQGIEPIGFDTDPHILYYRGYKSDRKVLYKMDVRTKQSELVFEDPDYDFDGNLIYSATKKSVVGVTHLNSPTGRVYWDKQRKDFIDSINLALPDVDNYLIDFSSDEKRYLVYSESDGTPGVYYLGDRTTGKMTFILQQYPDIPNGVLPHHRLLSYKARDGIEIEGYLTLPTVGEKPYPLVMHPHGGPGARDISGFDYWTSYFNNLGYAVFRPNFRGSTGYGFTFEQAQVKSWGLQMQDDITDATNWLVAEGIALKDKMCIVGASYGGYAAIMATVKTPELFQCAVSFAGVLDLKMMVSKSRHFTNKKFVKHQYGDDYEDLKNRSPYYHTDKIATPVLLLHGEDDRIVDVEHSREMYDELQDEGKKVKYVELENGDHYLSIQRNRHIVFKEMEAFLAKYLQ